MPEPIETREAEYGSRMIEVRVRFWTDSIADGKGKIRPKHAWSNGVVRLASNASHGIKPKNPRPFNSISELSMAIEKVLIEHGVKIHPNGTMKKLLSSD